MHEPTDEEQELINAQEDAIHTALDSGVSEVDAVDAQCYLAEGVDEYWNPD